ncbi:MAG: type II toxin-antitoxin system PemK/MazF family toxin [Methylobacter sp.]|nr:type II toxin-antitoxin system PemK/MazF family toxin [Methylobacter sp.]
MVLFRFPQTDQKDGKLRPALILRKLPGKFDDWLICMISSQLHQVIPGLDEIINLEETNFQQTGLKQSSLIRASRLAVVDDDILIGKLGNIDTLRLNKIRGYIAKWLQNSSSNPLA